MIETQFSETTTLQDLSIDLINGEFNSKDGLEIVSQLVEEKIRLLNVRNFSQLIRTGEQDIAISERMEDLKREGRAARELFAQDYNGETRYRINAKIVIEQV